MIASIITALYLFGIVSASSASNFLIVSGIMLIAAEVALSTFWIIGFNGLLAVYVGYVLRTGSPLIFGVPFDWGLLFGLAFIEFIMLAGSIFIYLRFRRIKISTGTESMIGHKAVIVSWKDTSGQVHIQGETWKASSDKSLQLSKGENVTVSAIDGLTLKITP